MNSEETNKSIYGNLSNYKNYAEARLKTAAIPEEDKKLILEYVRQRTLAEGSRFGLNRQYKYLTYLRTMGERLGKPYQKAKRKDLEALVKAIREDPCFLGEKEKQPTEWTIHEYLLILKKFFKWVKQSDNPEETAWIKLPQPKIRKLMPEDILTWDEVVKVSQCATNPRDRALPQVLWDSGLRIGELLSMTYKDAFILHDGAAIRLTIRESKTDLRDPVIVRSAPALVAWLRDHPTKNPDGSLWCMKSGEVMSYAAAHKVLRDLKERSGMRKRMNPHSFRKSSASFFSHHLKPQELKARFGWNQSSRMLDVYCFPDQDETNRKVMEMFGLTSPGGEKRRGELKPVECFFCHTLNPAGQRFCIEKKCGRPLNPEDYMKPQRFIESCDSRENDVQRMVEDLRKEIQELKKAVLKP